MFDVNLTMFPINLPESPWYVYVFSLPLVIWRFYYVSVWDFDVSTGRKEIYGPPLAQFDSMNRHRFQVSCRYHSGCEDCQWGCSHMITKHPNTIPENMCSVLKLHQPLDLVAMALSMISRHDFWNACVLGKEIKFDRLE
jgi:hypothetical protein